MYHIPNIEILPHSNPPRPMVTPCQLCVISLNVRRAAEKSQSALRPFSISPPKYHYWGH